MSPASTAPGTFFLVVGPSGAGKDTLLGLAKAACAEDSSIVFSRRVVTRASTAAEDNEELGLDAFREALGRTAAGSAATTRRARSGWPGWRSCGGAGTRSTPS